LRGDERRKRQRRRLKMEETVRELTPLEKRMRELLDAEKGQPMGWWYLSYTGEEGFRGGIIIEARGFVSATLLANILKISPGGEVAGLKIPPDHLPPGEIPTRLLSKDELTELWGDLKTLDVLEGRSEREDA
jgi:hypothetical protein